MSNYTGPFVIRVNGEPTWQAAIDGEIIPAEFNSRGAALAAIEVEKRRRARKEEK